jgi:hypothetical protein
MQCHVCFGPMLLSSIVLPLFLSMDFVSHEHGVPRDGPKDSNAGG